MECRRFPALSPSRTSAEKTRAKPRALLGPPAHSLKRRTRQLVVASHHLSDSRRNTRIADRLEPEGVSVPLHGGQFLPEQLQSIAQLRILRDEPGREANARTRVTSQEEGGKYVLLGPVASSVSLGVVVRKRDVVYPDEYARRQLRENLQEEDDDIGVHERTVGAVEEDDVSRLQCGEYREICLLEGASDHHVAETVDLGAWTRVDRHHARFKPGVADGTCHEF